MRKKQRSAAEKTLFTFRIVPYLTFSKNCYQFLYLFKSQHIQIQKSASANNNKFQLIMNFSHHPCFFMYYPNEPYYNMGFYSFPHPNFQFHHTGQPNVSRQIQQPENSRSLQYQPNNQEINQGIDKNKKISKMKQKKIQSPKVKALFIPQVLAQDIQFRHRQQTVNRNLSSNTLKVYFKQLRDEKTQTFLNISKIIENHNLNISAACFLKRVDELFPPSATYISFDSIKKIFNSCIETNQQFEFNKIFRISIVRFYSYDIFAVNIKSIRTTRKIRNQQIKQGKIFLRELSL